jgi:hypothetical protein
MVLPTFLIIGAAKAGTTALYEYCRQHPDVFMSPLKETNFFAYEGKASETYWLGYNRQHKFPVQSLEAYADLFAPGAGATARGEASPLYLESPRAAERIQKILPNVKLVACLRNPAERAYSAWLMHVRMGRASSNPAEAFPPDAHYVEAGFYHRLLAPYFELFPREQIAVLLFEEFRSNPAAVMRELFRFLEVDPEFRPDVDVRHNVGTYPRHERLNALLIMPGLRRWLQPVVPLRLREAFKRLRERNLGSAPPLPPDLRRQLLDMYREDILRLQDLLGQDLSGWLAEPDAPRRA